MTLKELYRLVPRHKRAALGSVAAGTVLLALLDLVGVAALVSVLLLILDEGALLSNDAVRTVYDSLGFSSVGSFTIAVSIGVLLIVALKSGLSLVVSNYITKYLLSLYRYYSTAMFGIYLSKGLLFIRSNHTSRLVNNINGICIRFTDGVIGQLVTICSQGLLLVLMMLLLLLYNPLIFLLAVAVFLPLALIYSRLFRKRMIENGKAENRLSVAQNKTLYETLRGYADIEINNAGGYVAEKFGNGLRTLSDVRRRSSLIRMASGRVVEFSLVLGVVVMIIAGLIMGNTMASLKASLGIFAIAAYKIVPAVSKTVNAWIEFKRNAYAAETIAETFSEVTRQPLFCDATTARIDFSSDITLDGVSFAYPGGEKVLDNFSLTIRKGERIGIRGRSGAGKTTLFNIICGFFEPTEGRILIDGRPLSPHNCREWQNTLACVSQDVFIPDITIAENVAFGTARDQIDTERMWNALQAASLADFVRSLPAGADTVTGESGCRLSGGQRQRIGIARALYKRASVLLFDEATSSLDNRTESEIVRAIEKLSSEHRELTMLIISHRDHTLSFCDRVISLEP